MKANKPSVISGRQAGVHEDLGWAVPGDPAPKPVGASAQETSRAIGDLAGRAVGPNEAGVPRAGAVAFTDFEANRRKPLYWSQDHDQEIN